MADTLPRTPAAPFAAGRPFAAREPQRVPGIREWATQVAAGADAGVGISLRLDLSSFRLFDEAEPEEVRRAGAAVVQVHSLADPTLVTDAGLLWAGAAAAGFGPRARIDAVLALRRAARVWPPLLRLLDQPVPDALALSDPELEDLLGAAAPASRRPESRSTGRASWPVRSRRPPSYGPPRPVPPPTAPRSSTRRGCSPSPGSWPWAGTGSPRVRWTPSRRRTGP